MSPGRVKCRKHGGKSPPPGISHPTFKHGRYSKALHGDLLERIQDAQQHPDAAVLNLRDNIDLIDAQLSEAAQNVCDNQNAISAGTAVRLLAMLDGITQATDPVERAQRFNDIRSTLVALSAYRASQNDLVHLTEVRAKLVATQVGNLVRTKQLMTVSDAILRMNHLAHVFISLATEHGLAADVIKEAFREAMSGVKQNPRLAHAS